MRSAAALLLFATTLACLPGPETLAAQFNAEVVVVGVVIGDELEVAVAGQTLRSVVRQAPTLTLHVALPSGAHEGTLVARRATPLCAAFVLDVAGSEGLSVAAVDLGAAAPCDGVQDAGTIVDDVDAGEPDGGAPPQDAGTADAGGDDDAGAPPEPVVAFEEGALGRETPGCGAFCSEELLVRSDGSATRSTSSGDEQGQVSGAALQELAVLLTSTEADALYASGGCPVEFEPSELVRRRVLIVAGPIPDVVDETVDVTACGDQFTSELRASFGRIESEVFGF